MSLLPDNGYEMDMQTDIQEDPYVQHDVMFDTKPKMTHDAVPADKYLVVIPSIRPIPWEYFTTLKNLDIFICDDSDGAVERPFEYNKWTKFYAPYAKKKAGYEFNRVFIANRDFTRSYVGAENMVQFPNHNPSVKNIGLYYAWNEGYEAVILLDDDCDTRRCALGDFLTIGKGTEAWRWNSNHNWMNTVSLINQDRDRKMFARGFPYEYRHLGYSMTYEGRVYPYFNEGLWTGHPDINGMDKLEMMQGLAQYSRESEMPWWIDEDTKALPGQVVLDNGQQLPLSIMNCQIHTSLIPAFFQPADHGIYNTFKIRRHDDIWSMYLLKRIMDQHNLDVTVGNPLIRHRKAGNVVNEILSEHYTNLIQRYMMDCIDEAHVSATHYSHIPPHYSIAETVSDMIDYINTYLVSKVPGIYGEVLFAHFSKARAWANLFI